MCVVVRLNSARTSLTYNESVKEGPGGLAKEIERGIIQKKGVRENIEIF